MCIKKTQGERFESVVEVIWEEFDSIQSDFLILCLSWDAEVMWIKIYSFGRSFSTIHFLIHCRRNPRCLQCLDVGEVTKSNPRNFGEEDMWLLLLVCHDHNPHIAISLCHIPHSLLSPHTSFCLVFKSASQNHGNKPRKNHCSIPSSVAMHPWLVFSLHPSRTLWPMATYQMLSKPSFKSSTMLLLHTFFCTPLALFSLLARNLSHCHRVSSFMLISSHWVFIKILSWLQGLLVFTQMLISLAMPNLSLRALVLWILCIGICLYRRTLEMGSVGRLFLCIRKCWVSRLNRMNILILLFSRLVGNRWISIRGWRFTGLLRLAPWSGVCVCTMLWSPCMVGLGIWKLRVTCLTICQLEMLFRGTL